MIAAIIEWQFGGFLRGWPPALAWSALGVCAVAGSVLAAWFYGRTLRALSPGARIALTALRVAIVLVVVWCLANPTRVERRPAAGSPRDTLAVLVDGSDSMTAADGRGTTRLASAVRAWKQHEPEAARAFPHTTYRRFAVTADTASSLDDATSPKTPGPETHLYEALRQTLDQAPRAVVCLTDGLDTTRAPLDALAAEAQRRGVPFYFVPGTNRTRASELVNIREIKAPSQVLRRTRFTASALLEITSLREQNVPVELWSGPTRLAAASLPVRAGLNTLSWPVQTESAEPGPMGLEFRVGAGDRQQVAACTTQVIERAKVEVLYYQGALQWGYRYLLAALESDPSFHVTGVLNPALGVQITAGAAGRAVLPDLPDDPGALRRFQIIVLAHVFADRLTDRQQRALAAYARGGGGVLFIAPDSAATGRFAGTELEQMLPVAFETASPARTEDDRARRFQEQMAYSDGGDPMAGNEAYHRQTLPRLQPFALPPGANRTMETAIFRNTTPANLPRFCNYARVRAVKPGADVLAVQGGPSAPAEAGPPRVLLARQPFGDGFTAALTTDLLWRWKMSLPSASRAVETFWQQLLLSLAPPPGTGLRLVKLSGAPSVRASVALRVEGNAGAETAPTVEAISPDGQHRPLALRAAAGSTDDAAPGGTWTTDFTPDAAGRWEVRATALSRDVARVSFPVSEKKLTAESLDQPPDVEGMRRLAQSTGGALIEEEPVFQDPAAATLESAQPRRLHPMWHSPWLLALLLGLYGGELILRRWFRLI